jgi:Flp pilus assembly protein TadD
VRAAWPLALLLVYAAVFRGTDAGNRIDAQMSSASGACEQAGAADVPALERCLDAQPDDVEAMLDLGGAYELAGRADEAERLYRRALTVDARDGDVHLRLARLLLARGDRTGARREGEAALAMQPGSPDAMALAATAIERAAR